MDNLLDTPLPVPLVELRLLDIRQHRQIILPRRRDLVGLALVSRELTGSRLSALLIHRLRQLTLLLLRLWAVAVLVVDMERLRLLRPTLQRLHPIHQPPQASPPPLHPTPQPARRTAQHHHNTHRPLRSSMVVLVPVALEVPISARLRQRVQATLQRRHSTRLPVQTPIPQLHRSLPPLDPPVVSSSIASRRQCGAQRVRDFRRSKYLGFLLYSRSGLLTTML